MARKELSFWLSRAARASRALADIELGENGQRSGQEWLLLEVWDTREGVRLAELTRQLGISRGVAWRSVRRLEHAGMVACVSVRGRRAVNVVATKNSRMVEPQVRAVVAFVDAVLESRFRPGAAARLRESLRVATRQAERARRVLNGPALVIGPDPMTEILAGFC